MDGDTLERALAQDPHVARHFFGVFAADTLPHPLPRKPALLIVNTDPISKPGQHWVAIHVNAHGKGFYFDSYGLKPYIEGHRRFLARSCKTWKYNHVDLQDLNSSVCGQYCVMFLLFKAHGYSMRDFLKLFSNNCQKNDELVDAMFRKYGKSDNLCKDVRSSQQAGERRVRKRM